MSGAATLGRRTRHSAPDSAALGRRAQHSAPASAALGRRARHSASASAALGRPVRYALLAGSALLALCTLALAQGIGIRVLNDTNRNLKVTVYDLTAPPGATPVLSQTINSFASIHINAQIGEDGFAHIRWVATSIGPDPHRCSHSDRTDLTDGATLRVFANGACEDTGA